MALPREQPGGCRRQRAEEPQHQWLALGLAIPRGVLAQGGYDTHANQVARHGRVLSELAAALAAFAAGLERLPNGPAVTLLAVSEFGRRLRENGSRGTDHGSASVALVFGDQLPERLIGQYPSLSALDERGDLIPGLSPPELYRRVLQVAGI